MSEYQSLNDLAYTFLRDRIYRGGFDFHQIYSETKLAAEISVSRTPMRDALNRLAHERYIDILPNRGFTLHVPTREDIAEAYHIRMMTEGYCAEVAARDVSSGNAEDTLSCMEAALQQQSRLLENDGDYTLGRFWLDDLRFHEALLAHLRISSLIRQYENVMYIFMPHHLLRDPERHGKDGAVLDRHRSTIREHGEILTALQSGDLSRVRAKVRAHIDSSLAALYNRMDADERSDSHGKTV